MGIPILIILIASGIVLLKLGADWFVSGSSSLARRIGASEMAIGLTVVAFGTSAPELVVNIFAASEGNADIVFGNIIGSNMFNLFVILGIVGVIAPVTIRSDTAKNEIPFSLLALLLLFVLSNNGILPATQPSELSRWDGILLLAGFLLFLGYIIRQLIRDSRAREPRQNHQNGWKILVLMAAGLAGLVAGGKLVMDHSVKLATLLGMSEKMIGLTIVAAGTSLPELATSVVAAMKRNHDMALGNIVGSNIFNILFILPVSSVIRPMAYNTSFNLDMAVIAAGTLLLTLSVYTGKKNRLDRWEAFVLLSAYAIYLVRAFTTDSPIP